MKIYLSDSLSLLEFLYLESIEESNVELVNNLADADTLVGLNSTDLYYDKTIIINNDSVDKESLEELSKFNKIVSRFPLDVESSIEYEVIPYIPETKLLNLEFDGSTRNVLSRLSIKQFILSKSQGKYRLKKPNIFVNTKVRNHDTIIGLLQSQLS